MGAWRPGGRLVYVVPGPRHLYQLKQVRHQITKTLSFHGLQSRG